MKKIILFSAVLFCISSVALSQDGAGYSTAIGVRLGPSVPAIKSGITIKHFLGNNAIEGIISFGDGVGICGLYEIHKPCWILRTIYILMDKGFVNSLCYSFQLPFIFCRFMQINMQDENYITYRVYTLFRNHFVLPGDLT